MITKLHACICYCYLFVNVWSYKQLLIIYYFNSSWRKIVRFILPSSSKTSISKRSWSLSLWHSHTHTRCHTHTHTYTHTSSSLSFFSSANTHTHTHTHTHPQSLPHTHTSKFSLSCSLLINLHSYRGLSDGQKLDKLNQESFFCFSFSLMSKSISLNVLRPSSDLVLEKGIIFDHLVGL